METPKGFADRVERWMGRVPGVRTYRERERRRETDKKLRENLASGLGEVRSQLKKIVLDSSSRGEMDSLPGMDRLSSHLQQMIDDIRYAAYGYGGIFDLEKIREDQLDRLYNFDLLLTDDVEKIRKSIEEIGQAASPEARKRKTEEAESFLGSMETKFRQRKDWMSRPPDGRKQLGRK